MRPFSPDRWGRRAESDRLTCRQASETNPHPTSHHRFRSRGDPNNKQELITVRKGTNRLASGHPPHPSPPPPVEQTRRPRRVGGRSIQHDSLKPSRTIHNPGDAQVGSPRGPAPAIRRPCHPDGGRFPDPLPRKIQPAGRGGSLAPNRSNGGWGAPWGMVPSPTHLNAGNGHDKHWALLCWPAASLPGWRAIRTNGRSPVGPGEKREQRMMM
jgi:hypothetical protein